MIGGGGRVAMMLRTSKEVSHLHMAGFFCYRDRNTFRVRMYWEKKLTWRLQDMAAEHGTGVSRLTI
jgi:hypothetical protein